MTSALSLLALCSGLTLTLAAGCAGEHWSPPPPAGVTYQYDYQGFRERNTTVVAGSVADRHGMGAAFAGAFSFQDDSELRGPELADPFAESSPIDGVRFNSHLGAAGIRLAPAPMAAPSSSGRAVPQSAPSASGWPAAPPGSAAPAPTVPGGYL